MHVIGFISHTVQMKPRCKKCVKIIFIVLYIPHGSDETILAILLKSVFYDDFISHTVQMKPVPNPNPPPPSSEALYPTRFR